MLLRHSLELTQDAEVLETAGADAITDGARTKDIAARGARVLTTREAGDAVLAKLG